ncbi:CBY1-interacting BAR domain-containing protein 1 isoform X2 [Microtus pennsylvanicus]|uniref:CBY1-interacting BAR domain-containing protein 1 isoform X2 n=1 Tax=Microtus pennsylvanicus TaxID=10058 RepID=UPI003F6A98FF
MPSGLPCPALDRRGARRVATETSDRRGGAHGALSPPGRSGGGSLSRAPWRPGAALVGLPPLVLGGAQGKMLRRNLEDRDAQTKQLQDAVTNVEKHFGELCQIFAAYVRKTARLRDKADLLVNEINLYASTETPNLKQGLKNFADEFAKLQDYRQAEAETELQRATIDATRTSRHLEETIDNFEKQKIKDIKNIFSEFITIEMLFHGKALEVFTAAYQNIQKIDEDEDLEVFRNSLYLPDYPSRLDIVRANSKSPLQRSVSTKCASGTGQITTCRTRKDQQVEDEDDEELDVTEDEN